MAQEKKKKVLFVINTLGGGGAEMSLRELLLSMEGRAVDIHLLVLTGQGELVRELPPYVRLRNTVYTPVSVFTRAGKWHLAKGAWRAFWRRGRGFGLLGYWAVNLRNMLRAGTVQPDKLLWRLYADAAPRLEEEFDLAIAYLEGGSVYYVADYVRAREKAAFVHTAYDQAGYTAALDGSSYDRIDRIYVVAQEMAEHFLQVHPHLASRLSICDNPINQPRIRQLSLEAAAFPDGDFRGIRILSVGRLCQIKGYDLAIEAMAYVRQRWQGPLRWYVLGEGEARAELQRRIRERGLEKDFLLLGFVENPYPYYRKCDIFVNSSRFEGRSIAIQEAMTLGLPVVAADRPGNRQQLTHGRNGLLQEASAQGLGEGILYLLRHPGERGRMGEAAEQEVYAAAAQARALLLGEEGVKKCAEIC